MATARNKKILVLMSGGVDSSTVAALLVEAGHEVAGVYLKLWQAIGGGRASVGSEARPPDIGDPCWANEMRDAARVAAQLCIPFTVWNVTEEYKKRVLENFYAEYTAGRTPNPDVLCNSEIKFGVALEKALAAGYDYVATGHYARLSSQSSVRSSQYELWSAVDKNKDQSYFLWRLTQDQLAHVLFPIGECTKPQVREMAERFGLHNAQKKDSQGVCFLGKIELKEFLYSGPLLTSPSKGEELSSFPLLGEEGLGVVRRGGPIHDVHGQLLGFHDGLAHFTIGQRQGTKLGGTGPYYVIEKDVAHNALIVAHDSEESNYRVSELTVCDANWIGEAPQNGALLMARTRYRAPLQHVQYYHTREYGSIGRILFEDSERAVAPGQSIVFYEGERVIGGGIIQRTAVVCKVPKFAHVS